MQDELLRLQKQLQKTIIFISHDIHEALKIGDRIAVMKDGSIVQVGTPSELITQPTSDYIRAFTRDVNRAQVLKAGSIARQTMTLILGQNSPRVALEQMLHHNLKQMYVIDGDGKLVGIVQKNLLEEAIRQGSECLSSVMLQNFPKANASTKLENILHLYQQGLTVAVVDDKEKFKGVIEASDVLASISSI
jgi:glycine betaine/proline transport system ATP-binding protein